MDRKITRRISGGAAVRCIRWFAGVSYEKDNAKRRIANMSGEWIPVTERLPYEGQDVLAYSAEIGTQVAHIEGESWYWGTSGILGFDATHWMPLPATPTDAK